MAVAPKPVEPKYMGQRIRRREDPRLITGSATYVDDLKLPGTLYMGVLRSPYAHARITRIDVERARGLPNVVAAITADDIADVLTSPMPVEVSMKLFAESHLPRRGPLATDKVRCVGDAV